MQQVFEGSIGDKKVLIKAEGEMAEAEYYVDGTLQQVKKGMWTESTSEYRTIVMDACDWLSSKE